MTRGSRLLGIRAYTPIAPHLGERVEFENREPVAVGQAENKNLKMLAVTSRYRLQALSNVPTVEESGVRGFEA